MALATMLVYISEYACSTSRSGTLGKLLQSDNTMTISKKKDMIDLYLILVCDAHISGKLLNLIEKEIIFHKNYLYIIYRIFIYWPHPISSYFGTDLL